MSLANKYSYVSFLYIKIVTLSLNTWFHYFSNRSSIFILSLRGATLVLHVPPKPVVIYTTHNIIPSLRFIILHMKIFSNKFLNFLKYSYILVK